MRKSWIKVRVTEDELAAAKAKADAYEVGMSDFIRYCALGPSSAARVPHQRALESVAEQLHRIGNNLNQSVHLGHIAKNAGTLSEENLRIINGHVRALRREIGPYLKLLDGACGIIDERDQADDLAPPNEEDDDDRQAEAD